MSWMDKSSTPSKGQMNIKKTNQAHPQRGDKYKKNK